MRSASRRRTLRRGRIDGLKVGIINGPTLTDVEFALAFRMLARMMVHSHEAHADQKAIVDELGSSSPLTRAAIPRTDHTDEAA
jgi:hypothetical protein